MSEAVSRHTFVRQLSLDLRRRLSDFLDVQDRWKALIGRLRKPSGEPRYSVAHCRRFEALQTVGCSPTLAFLEDWGTTNSTVGELLDLLVSVGEITAASLLLPSNHLSSPSQQDSAHQHSVEDLSSEEVSPAATSCQEEDGGTLTSDLQSPEEEPEPGSSGVLLLSYSELRTLTNDFDPRPLTSGGSCVGQGGFSSVYKGTLHHQAVAVKRLRPMEDVPVEQLREQFNQEVRTLQRLKHRNLVELLASCCELHFCLLFPFMVNGSLMERLACSDSSPPLSWSQRFVIAEGAALGLEFLHRNHHVHRDVKSANVLLDDDFEAKLSDFGLTRASTTQTLTTAMTEKIVGSRAYMAPEALRGEVTPKSDVFSFGVVLLELLSGLPAADEEREQQFLVRPSSIIRGVLFQEGGLVQTLTKFGETLSPASRTIDVRENLEEEELSLDHFVDPKMEVWDVRQAEVICKLATASLHDRKNRRPVISQIVSEIQGVVRETCGSVQTGN